MCISKYDLSASGFRGMTRGMTWPADHAAPGSGASSLHLAMRLGDNREGFDQLSFVMDNLMVLNGVLSRTRP